MNTEIKSKLIIISSPSGAGKTTLCKLLLKKMKNISLSISYTSRNKRLNEIDGKDYYFVTEKKFKKLEKNKFFIETAINFKNYSGVEDGDGFSPKLEEAAKLIKASTDKKMLSGGVVGTINHNN